eukprot:TRINITY_DN5201_c0_g1_i8.p1 TRINITY_DN5201_c0_g1~~TRINITY_DN5201_c0_g1_i8.p1  ORF type:complete len:739 (+),score=134.33 TRINITY_DN5201_c0_g1_i8:42-2258(+)
MTSPREGHASAPERAKDHLPHGPVHRNVGHILSDALSVYMRNQTPQQHDDGHISPEEFLTMALEWLRDPARLRESYAPDDVIASCMRDDVFLGRVAQVSMDNVLLSQSMTPPVEVWQGSHDASSIIPQPHTFAVITGKPALMPHHLYPFAIGRDGYPVNIVCLEEGWLDESGRAATRILALDPEAMPPLLVETSLTTPLTIHAAIILELPTHQEVAHHASLSKRLKDAGVHVINDAESCARCCDDKAWLRGQVASSSSPAFEVPECALLSPDLSTSKTIASSLRGLVAARPTSQGIILQRAANTTEGQDVSYFPFAKTDDDIQMLVDHIQHLMDTTHDDGDGNVLASSFRGDVYCTDQKKNVVVRLNAAAGGHVTASVVFGAYDRKIVSLGGETCAPGRLSNLKELYRHDQSGLNLCPTSYAWKVWRQVAQAVLSQVALPLVGIDVVLEARQIPDTDAHPQYYPHPVVLEVNGRPGSLIFAEVPSFNNDGTFSSRHTSPVNYSFWQSIIPPSTIPLSSSLSSSSSSSLHHTLTIVDWLSRLTSRSDSSLHNLFVSRYGNDPGILEDRYDAYVTLLRSSLMQGFDDQRPVVVVASPGRDRVFMGHTDLTGLGGPTINSTTKQEILCVMQVVVPVEEGNSSTHGTTTTKAEDMTGILALSNYSTEFSPCRVSLPDELIPISDQPVCKVWDPALGQSYIKGALAVLLASQFHMHKIEGEKLGVAGEGAKPCGVRAQMAGTG